MIQQIPRILLAGTNSGCGKTTVTCGILKALIHRGYRVGAFKCGPDYIDPMFHSEIIGAKSGNLDLFFHDPDTVRTLLAKNSRDCHISIIEGVMGFYDGAGFTTTASTYEMAQITHSPVVLVVDAKGASLSVLASIHGFCSLYPHNHIVGVILNRCTSGIYEKLSMEILSRFSNQIKPLGYMPSLPECRLESRHLGLITAAEVQNLQKITERLGRQAEQTICLDELMALSRQAPALSFTPKTFSWQQDSVRIAVARDRAFCFYYQDSLGALEEMGAQLVPFAPLSDSRLPEQIHGIYLGGGYPELYAAQLSKNKSMLTSVRTALERGVPCIAECGGYMYLTEAIGGCPMVGYLPGKCVDTGKLTRFGYVKLRACHENMLCREDEEIAAHEFHRWDCSQRGNSFTAQKLSGEQWPCVVATPTLYAGFPHFHFYSNPAFAIGFYQSCLKEKYAHVEHLESDGD